MKKDSRVKLPPPKGRRELADLLDCDCEYRDSIAWQPAGGGIETYAVPIRDMDTVDVDGVWGYIVRYTVQITVHRGTPKERTAARVKTPRRGFATEAKAIAYAQAKIDAASEPLAVFDDTAYLGTPEQRARTDRAYRDYALGRGSVEKWEAERAKLPR